MFEVEQPVVDLILQFRASQSEETQDIQIAVTGNRSLPWAESASAKDFPDPRQEPALSVEVFVGAEPKRHGEDGHAGQT